tara:strand:- start:3132 stop:3995 length:864 start_codon:yes stop_codon:yes gene_type:complete
MSEIINLAKGNGDDHVYEEAIKIASKKLKNDYSFIIQVWDHDLPKETKYPKVFVSTSDESHQAPKQIYDDDFVHIFKQYVPLAKWGAGQQDATSIEFSFAGGLIQNKVTALPLCHLEGVKDQGLSINERKYDWSWMGQFNPYTRLYFRGQVDNLLSERPDCRSKVLWYDGWNNGEETESYSDVINNTKIVPVPIGSGSYESFRFFEAMMCGCVVLNTKLPTTDFYNNAPHVRLTSWDQIVRAIDILMADPSRMQVLSDRARQWYKDFCSPEAISNLIISKLEGVSEN